MLQRFQRSEPAASCLDLLARIGQFRLHLALLFLQRRQRRLAFFQGGSQAVEAGLVLVVFGRHRCQRSYQCRRIEAAALGSQHIATTRRIRSLLFQVFDLGALDFRPARGLRLGARVRVPTLLPVVQRRFRDTQGFLALLVIRVQCGQARIRLGNGAAQVAHLALVAGDVLADLRKRGIGLGARGFKPLPEFALVGDLLFDARQLTADSITLGLHRAKFFAGFALLHAAGLDLRLGGALVGEDLLQLQLILGQQFAKASQFRIELAIFQRLQLRVLVQAFGLQALVLLGGACLALQVVDLLVHFLAQVGQALEILAGMANPGFGFLAPFLVLGNAGSFFQVNAQVFGPGLDDLGNHSLLDDRVTTRAKAGTEEQVGDVATAATRAIEVIVGLAIAADRTLYRNLGIAGVLTANGAFGIVENQLDRGLADRLARR